MPSNLPLQARGPFSPTNEASAITSARYLLIRSPYLTDAMKPRNYARVQKDCRGLIGHEWRGYYQTGMLLDEIEDLRKELKDEVNQTQSQLSRHLDLARPDMAVASTIEKTLDQALSKLRTETQMMTDRISWNFQQKSQDLESTMTRMTSEADRMKREADRQANEAEGAKAEADRMAAEADRAAKEKRDAAEESKSLKKQLKRLDSKYEAMDPSQPKSIKRTLRKGVRKFAVMTGAI